MNKIYILTGPPGVGKSTISYEIGNKLEKSVVIEGDTIYNFFVGGRIKLWLSNAPLNLFWNNSIMLIKSYLANGYDVVFNYIIKEKELNKLKQEFKDYKINFTCLIVDEKEILRRDSLREEDNQMHERCIILLNDFKKCKFNKEDFLNTTNLSIEETTSKILNK